MRQTLAPPELEPPALDELDLEHEADHQDSDAGPKRYFLLEFGADPALPVPVTQEEDLDAAAEKFLVPNLQATNPYPPWVKDANGKAGPPFSLVPGFKIALAKPSRRFIIGEADWNPDETMTHGHLWGFFGDEEIHVFRRAWHDMERTLEYLRAHGKLPDWAV